MKAREHNKKLFKEVYDDAVNVNAQAVQEGEIMYDTIFMLTAYVLSMVFIFKHLELNEFVKIFLVLLLSKTMLTKIYQSGKEYLTMFKENLKILRESRKR